MVCALSVVEPTSNVYCRPGTRKGIVNCVLPKLYSPASARSATGMSFSCVLPSLRSSSESRKRGPRPAMFSDSDRLVLVVKAAAPCKRVRRRHGA